MSKSAAELGVMASGLVNLVIAILVLSPITFDIFPDVPFWDRSDKNISILNPSEKPEPYRLLNPLALSLKFSVMSGVAFLPFLLKVIFSF